MINVNDELDVSALFAESVPVNVIVYVPLGGSGTVFPLVPPQAEIASPIETSARMQASCRSFRERLPTNPANASPANATSGGNGVSPPGILLPREAVAVGLMRETTFSPRPFSTPPVVGLLAQSAAFVSIVICAVTGVALLTVADPSPFSPVPTSTHRFASDVSFEVAYPRFTVPVYPSFGVNVNVSFCCVPLFTVRLDGDSAMLKVPFPIPVPPPTVTIRLPVDAA